MKHLKPIFNFLILLVAICVASVGAMAQITEVTITVNPKAYIVPKTVNATVCQNDSIDLFATFVNNVYSSQDPGKTTPLVKDADYTITFSLNPDGVTSPITKYKFDGTAVNPVSIYAKTFKAHLPSGSCDTIYSFTLTPQAPQTPTIAKTSTSPACGNKTTEFEVTGANNPHGTTPNYTWGLISTVSTTNKGSIAGTNLTAVADWNNNTNAVKDTVTFAYTDVNTCIWYDSLEVDIYPTSVITTTLSAGTVCALDTVKYKVVTDKTPTGFAWDVLNPSTNVSGTKLTSPAETKDSVFVAWENTTAGLSATDGTATLRYVSSLTTSSNVCYDTTQATISIHQKPVINLTAASDVCNAESIQLSAELKSGNATGWSFHWMSNPALNQEGDVTPTANPMSFTVTPNTSAASVKYGITRIVDGFGCDVNIPQPTNP